MTPICSYLPSSHLPYSCKEGSCVILVMPALCGNGTSVLAQGDKSSEIQSHVASHCRLGVIEYVQVNSNSVV